MNKLNFKHFAFSLIELTITIVIVSIVLAAFIPQLSKKSSADNVSVSKQEITFSQCEDEFGEDCAFCDEEKTYCALCTKECPEDLILDKKICACVE